MTHKKIIYFILFIFLSNCSAQKVTRVHGTLSLKTHEDKIILNKTNTNDVINLIGEPSTKSSFDNNVWIYIERQQTQSELKNLGKMKIYKNDVLVLEINEYGILKKKNFYNQENMNDIKITKDITGKKFKKNSFVYDFMSSLRQKVNDPLGVRAKKRKEISQR